MTVRQFWRRLHLWIGLAGGILFVMLGLTGSILVYQEEILGFLYPEVMHVAPQAAMAPPSRIIAAAQQHSGGRVTQLRYPQDAGHAVQAVVTLLEAGRQTLMVDPYTLQIQGPMPGRAFALMFDLHSRLLLAVNGRAVIGWLGLAFAVSAITGIILWWPRAGYWRQAVALRWRNMSWFRRSFDLHKVSGAVTAVPLLLLALSGSAISFREALVPVMQALGGQPQARLQQAASAGPAASLDDLADEALRLMPGARLVFISPPARPDAATRIRLRQPGEIHQNGRSYVLFNASGKILDLQRVTELPAANLVFDQLPYPLHTGYILGEAGRLIVFVSGLLPALLFVTGVVLWLKRRR